MAFGFGRSIYALQKYGVGREILLTMLGRTVGMVGILVRPRAYNSILRSHAWLHNLYAQTTTQMAKERDLGFASKELSRSMASPLKGDEEKLKHDGITGVHA